jgi:hypothetical protein
LLAPRCADLGKRLSRGTRPHSGRHITDVDVQPDDDGNLPKGRIKIDLNVTSNRSTTLYDSTQHGGEQCHGTAGFCEILFREYEKFKNIEFVNYIYSSFIGI